MAKIAVNLNKLCFILSPSLTKRDSSEKEGSRIFHAKAQRGRQAASRLFCLCASASSLRLCVKLLYAHLVDKEALDQLMPIVYEELRRQAARYLRKERPGHTLQTTALIHEAYVRLVDQHHLQLQNRAQFFGIAAQLMRRILVDHARTKNRVKRGGSNVKVSIDDATFAVKGQDLDVVALDEALQRLAEIDEQQSTVVELRFFSGLTVEETAEVMGISKATVKRDWSMAKAWLHRELTGDAKNERH